jgi:hypothetical protein
MTDDNTTAGPVSRVGRRSLLLGAVGAGAAIGAGVASGAAAAAGIAVARPATVTPGRAMAVPRTRPAGPAAGTRVPPVIRSREALRPNAAPMPSVPLTQNGTTYNLAQEVRWLDTEHFAVGRWDGTMSIFEFETAPFVGPLVSAAVNTPTANGVQMITPLPRSTIVTSNDGMSLSVWAAPRGRWADLEARGTVGYDPALGFATNGVYFDGPLATLVVGHDSGFLSLWSFNPATRSLCLTTTVDVRNPVPVNPFGSHVMYGMCPLIPSGPSATVVGGSDDGYVSIVHVPSGRILSQTVFNPTAQRGINSVSARGDRLLVANCSVGSADHNLWYFRVNLSTWALTLLDQANLIIDTSRVQSFNFDTIWGEYSGGPCWFAGTEEGVLWMGTADTALHVLGTQSLFDGAIGAALDYTGGPGRLAAVIHNLNQFSTGAP